mgnify:CR=1 FL=1
MGFLRLNCLTLSKMAVFAFGIKPTIGFERGIGSGV